MSALEIRDSPKDVMADVLAGSHVNDAHLRTVGRPEISMEGDD